MNPPKCAEYDYINFLTATPKTYSCTEAERVLPNSETGPSHDSINRLLHRIPADAASLREESQQSVSQTDGVLVLDDSTLDKPYALKIEMVTRHQSGKHHRVVNGINLVSLLRTDGDAHIPCAKSTGLPPVLPSEPPGDSEVKPAATLTFCPS